MSQRTVKTQAELDKALADRVERIIIKSPEGVWLYVHSNGPDGSSSVVAWESSSVVARGSSSVEAWESSHVVARDSSHVEARESSHVVARGSSHVVARGSSSVEAWESSRVVARESSRVVARGSSHVVAWESSRVVAWESSRVVARGSSHVVAWESSRVVAWGSSSVEAWESSRVVAGAYVAVHLHSQYVTLTGSGHIIDMTQVDLDNPEIWCTYHGITVEDGRALLYKAVNAGLRTTAHIPTTYALGEEVSATDWKATPHCGEGLHFSPSPSQARDCAVSPVERHLAVSVAVADLIPLGADKCKAPSCLVLHEVDLWGERIEVGS